MFNFLKKHSIENIHKIFTIFTLIMVLAGCGFHLRGNYSLPPIMKSVYITPDDSLEPLQKSIRRSLKHNNVEINNTHSSNYPTIHLNQPVYSEQILATTANIQNQQVRMTMSFSYKITLNNKPLRALTNIQVTREMSINPNAPLTVDSERRIIKEELLKEGSNQFLRQLSTMQ